jgi:hypothetical protein
MLDKIKSFIVLLALATATQVAAQSTPEFSFVLYVTDALGNRDSIVLGYDATATDTADALFGDSNIANTAIDSVLDLRIIRRESFLSLDYQSKNAIFKYSCDSAFDINNGRSTAFLMLRAKQYPVTFSWNIQQFLGANNACHRGSFLTSSEIIMQYANLNIPSTFNTMLSNSGSYTTNYAASYIDYTTTMLNHGRVDTVFLMPFGFLDTAIEVGIDERRIAESLLVYPNPAKSYADVVVPTTAGEIAAVLVFDVQGQQISLPYSQAGERLSLNTSELAAGFYFCRLQAERKTYQFRFVKE